MTTDAGATQPWAGGRSCFSLPGLQRGAVGRAGQSRWGLGAALMHGFAPWTPQLTTLLNALL